MINVIETRAQDYAKSLIRGRAGHSLEEISSDLNSFLLTFRRYRDKHASLLIIRGIIEQNILNHREAGKCPHENQTDCPLENQTSILLFAIDQEVEDVIRFVEDISEHSFSSAEQSQLYQTINEVISKLKEMELAQSAGMEVLYEELIDLKERLNYDKKTFKQLVFGKIAESIAGGVIDKALGAQIYSSLTNGLNTFAGFLEKI
jgi:hypothetical protein